MQRMQKIIALLVLLVTMQALYMPAALAAETKDLYGSQGVRPEAAFTDALDDAAEGQIVLIEQPELHVHPRLHVEIGQLLADVIQGGRSQVLCETHSPEILLRVANTIKREHIRPEQCQASYIAQEAPPGSAEGGRSALWESRHYSTEITKAGILKKGWFDKSGFFPERIFELQDLGVRTPDPEEEDGA